MQRSMWIIIEDRVSFSADGEYFRVSVIQRNLTVIVVQYKLYGVLIAPTNNYVFVKELQLRKTHRVN